MLKEEKTLGGQRRIKLTPQQIKSLNIFYDCNSKPGNKDRIKIAQTLGIEIDRIKNWFQNRRAKDKKEAIENIEPFIPINMYKKRGIFKIRPNCNDLYTRRDV